MELEYIKLSEYAKLTGIHYRTATKHFHSGNLDGYVSHTGRMYVKNPNFKSVVDQTTNANNVILYARVSSSTDKQSLDDQIDRMRNYSAAKGYSIVGEYKEIASGLNDNRKMLNSIFNRNDYSILLVEHKDRLTRFGFNYIKSLLNLKNVSIEIINSTEDKDHEIIDDFISIITSFCEKIYGQKRKAKIQEIIDKLNEK